MMNNKYDINFSKEELKANSLRLTNQLWKLIPMRENEENWEKHLENVILEIAGLNEIFEGQELLQILSKLEGLKAKETTFDLYRTTVFKCISLIQNHE